MTRRPPAPDVDIAFRPLGRADLEQLHAWLCEPEVMRWYSKRRPTRHAVERKYGPRIDGKSATRVFIFELDGNDAGLCQTYCLGAYPSYATALGAEESWAGLDYFIGEARYRRLGLAHRIIAHFARTIVFADPATTACLASTDPANMRSIRALERAGFVFLRDVRTTEPEHLMILLRPSRHS